MTEEKNIDAGKQTDKSQEKFADERLSDDELDNVVGGTSELAYFDELDPQSYVGGK